MQAEAELDWPVGVTERKPCDETKPRAECEPPFSLPDSMPESEGDSSSLSCRVSRLNRLQLESWLLMAC